MTNKSSGRWHSRTGCSIVFFCLVIIGLVFDQITKRLAVRSLGDGRVVPILDGRLQLELYHNPGASLGLGSSATWLISLLALAASVLMLWAGLTTDHLGWVLTLGLAFAGADGNLIDRIIYANGFLNGKVIDFINYGWSIGNVADIFLTVAAVGFILLLLTQTPIQGSGDEDEGSDSEDGQSDSTDSTGVVSPMDSADPTDLTDFAVSEATGA